MEARAKRSEARERLEVVTDANWRDLCAAPVAVLVLSESGCPICSSWSRSLREHLDGTREWDGVRFGKIELDLPSAERFRAENAEWLELVDGVPFNVIYVKREPRASFAGAGMERLAERLRRHAPACPSQGAERASRSSPSHADVPRS